MEDLEQQLFKANAGSRFKIIVILVFFLWMVLLQPLDKIQT
jgi:hypothetical protein